MKNVVFTILSIIFVATAHSQSISVSSFKLLDSDLTANTTGTMEQDQNGEVAALIKVVTTQTGFTFDGGAMGIVKTKQTPGEIWVYVPRGSKKITIKHPQLGVLRDYFYPTSIESARTYEMILVAGTVQTIVQQARTSQYVVFQLTPPNAIVELDGSLLQTVDGTASKMMKFGSYDYRVQAPNYFPEAGKVTINDPDNKKIVNVSLKPNFSKVTVTVANNAEIWINGVKKGNGTWTGDLGEGTYEFEAKQQGHRSTLTTRDLIVTQEPQTINLQAPTPIYGEADINSSPAMADIYIDGEKMGKTPQMVSKLLIGSHQLRLNKNGYDDLTTSIIIKEGETTSLSVQLEKKKNVATTTKDAINQSSSDNFDNPKDNAQKAKYYNNIVVEAMKKVSKETGIITENQMAQQLGYGKIKSYDAIGLADAICTALNAAVECYKYDKNNKFSSKNAKLVWVVRPHLVNIGQEEARKGNNAAVLKYWGAFTDSSIEPLFASQNHDAEKEYAGQVAFFAGRYAFDAKDMARANRYFEIAKKDPTQKQDAENFQLFAMRSNLKNHADSLAFIDQLKQMYAAEPENEVIVDAINGMYEGLDKKAQSEFLDQHLAKYPNSFTALANKGLMAVNANNAEEGAKWLRKAAAAKPDNAVVFTYLGACLSVQAANTDDTAKRNDLYRQAIEAFDKAKELDPTRQLANWGYNRYQAYYRLYGADDPKTKAAEADMK